jgi:hypothetical protein
VTGDWTRRAWQKFVELYMSIDRRVLGAFRIGYGLVLVYDLLRRAAVLSLFYSNDGVLSNHYVLFRPQDEFQFSLLDNFSTPSEVRVAFVLIGLVYALYTLGLFTRLAQPLALICLTSLNSRNLFVEDGGVFTAIALGVWTLFLPVGERLSLDALRTEAGLATLHERVAWRTRSSVPAVSLSVLALSLQLCAIYWLNAAHKTGATWRDGEAVHYVLWQRRIVTDLGFWLAQHQPSWFSPAASYGTLAIEWLLPVFALAPWRWSRVLAFSLAVVLHGGIALTMTLGPFSYAMLALVSLRLPWPTLAALRQLWPRKMAWRWAGLRARLVQALRRGKCPWLRLKAGLLPRPALLGPLQNGVVLLLMVAALADLGAHNRSFPLHLARPRWLRSIVGYPRFFQSWDMFAPDAPRSDGAGVLDATTQRGRHVDPFTGREPSYDLLEGGPLPHGSIPADYLFQLHFEDNKTYRQELVRYLREWHEHEGRSDADRIVRFELWWLTRDSPPPGSNEAGPVRRELVFRDRP